jgi:hypothetical protein
MCTNPTGLFYTFVIMTLSVALSGELDEALTCICIAHGISKSRVIENLLREHATIQKEIPIIREEHKTGILAASRKIVKQLRRNKANDSQKAIYV